MKKGIVIRLAALKPRNIFASLAGKRRAGAHVSTKRPQQVAEKDLVQRLREAGIF